MIDKILYLSKIENRYHSAARITNQIYWIVGMDNEIFFYFFYSENFI